jgi:cytochrome c oxidase accessory protein FixG
MIFSEWSVDVEARAKKWVNRRFSNLRLQQRNRMARAVFYGVLSVASVFLAFVFTSYFVEPWDLLRRLLHLDLHTAGGITGGAVTLFTFFDFTFVRQQFCTTVCPYGYLQGVLQDKETLLVLYSDGTGDQKVCIECGKCVRVCEMGIDIRDSPYQIECVHCGECVDACEDVLRRIGRPGFIHYAWGERPPSVQREPWYKRWGFRDPKRVVILFVLMFYLTGLSVALSLRRTVLVRIAPDRSYLYKVLDDGRVANLMRVRIANRGSKPAAVRISVEGLPGAEIALDANPEPVGPAQEFERTFELRVRPRSGSSDVNHFRFLAQSSAESAVDTFEMTFILPEVKKP